jgi:transcriptional regulator with XRE-family HTH domain
MTGAQFKKLRESIGYSQARLSKEIDVTIRSITRWETGETPIPKIAEISLKHVAAKAKSKRAANVL